MADPKTNSRRGPLTGLRVIDCATLFAGPVISTLMGDFGADVIKVEHPSGDPLRNMGPKKNGHGLWWKTAARNKRCIALDLKNQEDARIFRSLVSGADVLVENFRTGRLRVGDWDGESSRRLNPRLDHGAGHRIRPNRTLQSACGFRHLGRGDVRDSRISRARQMARRPCRLSVSLTESPPISGVLLPCSPFTSVMFGGSGKGQYIDLAIYEPIFALLGPQPIIFDQLGIIQNRTGNRSVNNAPRNAYRTRDNRWVALSAAAPSIVRRVLELTGGPAVANDPRFQTNADRVGTSKRSTPSSAAGSRARSSRSRTRHFEKVEAAIAPIYDIEQIFRDPQFVGA